MELEKQDRVLDFGPMGMRWEITRSGADNDGELFEAVNVLAPGFAPPPLHIHPTAEESYAVVSGTLDVCVGGHWRKVAAGQSVTVSAGTPHTLKNESGEEVRLVNVHRPALEFERFFRRLHALAYSGAVTFPPRGLEVGYSPFDVVHGAGDCLGKTVPPICESIGRRRQDARVQAPSVGRLSRLPDSQSSTRGGGPGGEYQWACARG